jgi:hypothetical protein
MPFVAICAPSYRGSSEFPSLKPPPRTQSMTRRFSVFPEAPAQTFILRQSSFCGEVPGGANACQQKGLNWVVFSTLSHRFGRFGGTQRSSPIGEVLYGMSLNASTPFASLGEPLMAQVLKVTLGLRASRSRREGAQEMTLTKTRNKIDISSHIFYFST